MTILSNPHSPVQAMNRSLWRQSLVLALPCLLALSCQQIKIKGSSSQTPQTSSADAQTDSKSLDRDERVDPPQNIIGSYLHCAIEQEPIDAKAEALVGCRLDNAEGQRTPASQLGASYHYSAGATSDPRVVVYSKDLAGDNRYDAAFLFIGPTRSAVLNAARETTIKIQIKSSKATGGDVLVGGKFGEVERSAASFPEAPSSDYGQVRDEILAGAANGPGSLPTNP